MSDKRGFILILKSVTVLIACVLAIQALTRVSGRAAQNPGPQIEFNRDIRPILSDKCLACHGPDAPNKAIGLRLDSEAGVLADLGGGRHAVVPGHPEQSELVRRITATDDGMRMPPVDSGRNLSKREITLLQEWIRQGAQWQKHWSFIAPRRPELPTVKNETWARNGIDRFVLERLEREGLTPAPEADRVTLIRRVSIDLTGLPPTPAEVDAFVSDKLPHAYERLVDRLLASPRYGERMAFKWLDAARYADTNGYQIDGERSMWRWRDWVIEAFNRNMPFDEFTVEQLAGDLLPNATLDQKIATAFNRNHRINAEGGVVPEEYRVEYVVDRVDTTSTVFMGLTIGCARCHNHKFDPVTQKEYYQLSAYFNSLPEDGRAFDQGNSPPWIPAPDRQQEQRLRELQSEIAQTVRQTQWTMRSQAASQRRWERSLAASPVSPASPPSSAGPVVGDQQWFPGDKLLFHLAMDGRSDTPVINKSEKQRHNPPEAKADDKESKKENNKPDVIGFKGGTPSGFAAPTGQAVSFDGSLWFDAGRLADFRYKSTNEDFKEQFTISVWVYPASEQAGAIVTKMADKVDEYDNHLPRTNGWGLFFANGKVHFNMVREWNYDGFRAETERALPIKQWHHVLLVFDGLRQYSDRIRIYINGQPERLKVNQPDLYLYWGQPETPLRIGAGGGPELRFKGAMAELRIYTRLPETDEIAALACATPLAKIAAIPSQRRTRGQAFKMQSAFLERAAPEPAQQLWKKLAKLKEAKKALEDSFPTLMVMQELPRPRTAFVLRRGAYDAPGEKVERGVPAMLPAMPKEYPDNRLGFAKWLVSAEHPLTARVQVNLLWQMLFGNGLVKTAEDFGTQGELPSHPELLDWLAVEFREGGWNVKALLKTMVTSATYRQSSRVPQELFQRDPENRLLAHGPRFRLSSEMIRDQALFVSGLLVERLGGPSVKPYQPEGLYKDMAFAGLTGYVRDKGEGLWRRSLYTYWKRTVLAPNMQVFDATAREYCRVRASSTNTPLQSLNLMNDMTYVEAARMLAQRMLTQGGTTQPERMTWAFRAVTSRQPTERELQVQLRNLKAQLEYFNRNPQEAARLLSVGEKRNDEKLNPSELAAYTATASLMLNLDEVITKQ